MNGAAPALIQLLLDTVADVTAAAVSTDSRIALAPSNHSTGTGPYWAGELQAGLSRDLSNPEMVVADVRRLLNGAIADEAARMGDAASVGGTPDLAVVDAAGARLL